MIRKYARRQLREANTVVNTSTKTIPAPPPGFVPVIEGFTVYRDAAGVSDRLIFEIIDAFTVYHVSRFAHAPAVGIVSRIVKLGDGIKCLPGNSPYVPNGSAVNCRVDITPDTAPVSFTVQYHYEPWIFTSG